MKFIHTADWHLGNRMHNVDRKEEFENFLSWLKTEIENQSAEVLVISGDIFDTANPPTEARTQYNKFLASLLGTCCKNIIIVGGNHDSGILLDSQKDILEALNIHVVGTVANLEPENMVFELKNGDDKVIGICAAVPYAHEIELKKFCNKEVDKGEFSDCAYGELYKQVFEAAEKLRNGRNIPVIATGHLYAANLEGRFSENAEEDKCDDGRRQLDVVGNLGSVHVGTFPDGFDYVALGHIHYPTMVAKNPKIRYSGSPFILGFDEHNIRHCILAVQCEKGDGPEVQKIEVPETVTYRRITGKSEDIKKELMAYAANPPEKETNIEVNYDWEEGININEVLEEIIPRLPENVAVVHKKRNEEQKVAGGRYAAFDEMEEDELTFKDIFTGLIMDRCLIDQTELDEDGIAKKQKELIDKYLPLLEETVTNYDRGDRYEDK